MSVKLYSNVEVAERGDAPTAHDILGASHTITGGAALDLVGQSAAGALARVTPSAAPGASAKVLASNATGRLILPTMQAAVFQMSGNAPTAILSDDDGAADAKLWDTPLDANLWRLRAVNDAYSAATDVLRAKRSGYTVTFVSVPAAALQAGTILDPAADGRTQLRTFGLVGGSIIWDYNGLDATTRTIFAHSAEDVVSAALIHFVIKPSTGAAVTGTVTLTPNTSVYLYAVASDTVTLYVATDGGVTVARTGGTLTYKLIVQMLWL